MVSRGAGRKSRDFWPGAALAAGSFLLLFLTRSAAQTGDSLSYVWAARTGQGLFHPHHLLFNFIIREMHLLSAAAGLGLTPLDAAQIHNILWSVAAVVSLYAIGRVLFASRRWALLAAAGLLVSQGFWEYATQAQSYAPAVGSLALLAFLLIRKPVGRFRTGDWAGIAVLLAVAVLYHQGNVLFVAPLAVFILLSLGPRGLRPLFLTGAFSGLIVVSAYAIGLVSSGGEKTAAGFVRFIFSYAYHPAPLWGTWRNFSPHGLGYLLFSQLRCLIPIWKAGRLFLLAGLGAGLAALFIGSAVRLRRRTGDRAWGAFLLTWLAVEYAFYLWWAPYDKPWFIVTVIPLIFLTGQAARTLGSRLLSRPGARPAASAAAALLLAAAAGFNYAASIRPLQTSLGRDYAEASAAAHCAAADEFILSSFDVQEHLRYYFGRRNLLQMEIIPMSLCQDLTLPAAYARLARTPFVLPFIYLLPQTRLSMVGGYDSPAGWRRTLEWIFDVRRDAGGEARDCRAFAELPCAAGYLRVGLERLPLAGWSDFLTRLDALGAAAFGADPESFRTWDRKTGAAAFR